MHTHAHILARKNSRSTVKHWHTSAHARNSLHCYLSLPFKSGLSSIFLLIINVTVLCCMYWWSHCMHKEQQRVSPIQHTADYRGVWHCRLPWRLTLQTTVASDTADYRGVWHCRLPWRLTLQTTVASDTADYCGVWHCRLPWRLTLQTTVASDTADYRGVWYCRLLWRLILQTTVASDTADVFCSIDYTLSCLQCTISLPACAWYGVLNHRS